MDIWELNPNGRMYAQMDGIALAAGLGDMGGIILAEGLPCLGRRAVPLMRYTLSFALQPMKWTVNLNQLIQLVFKLPAANPISVPSGQSQSIPPFYPPTPRSNEEDNSI
jgi:hypothetical protein